MDYQRLPDPGDGLRLHLNENTGGCSPRCSRRSRRSTRDAGRVLPGLRGRDEACARLLGVDRLVGRARPTAWTRASGRRRARACRAGDAAGGGDRLRAGVRHVRGLRQRGRRPRSCTVPPRPGLRVPARRACSPRSRRRTRVVFLAQPEQPDGLAIPAEDRRARSRARLPPGAVLFLDEAYVDFARESFLPRLAGCPERHRRAHVREGLRPGGAPHRVRGRAPETLVRRCRGRSRRTA